MLLRLINLKLIFKKRFYWLFFSRYWSVYLIENLGSWCRKIIKVGAQILRKGTSVLIFLCLNLLFFFDNCATLHVLRWILFLFFFENGQRLDLFNLLQLLRFLILWLLLLLIFKSSYAIKYAGLLICIYLVVKELILDGKLIFPQLFFLLLSNFNLSHNILSVILGKFRLSKEFQEELLDFGDWYLKRLHFMLDLSKFYFDYFMKHLTLLFTKNVACFLQVNTLRHLNHTDLWLNPVHILLIL